MHTPRGRRLISLSRAPLDQGEQAQQALFSNPNPSRIIAFESAASPAEREAMRARAAEAMRPAPLQHGKVQVPPCARAGQDFRRPAASGFFRRRGSAQPAAIEHHLRCAGCSELHAHPGFRHRRLNFMLGGMALMLGGIMYLGGAVFDRHTLPFLLLALLTIPVFYKLMWVYLERDSFGMTTAGLYLVDFDGNPPSKRQKILPSFGKLCQPAGRGYRAHLGLVGTGTDLPGTTTSRARSRRSTLAF